MNVREKEGLQACFIAKMRGRAVHSLARDRHQITVTAEGAQWGKMAEIPPNRLFWRRAASLDAFCVGFGTERRSEGEQLGRSAYLISLNQADLSTDPKWKSREKPGFTAFPPIPKG